MEGLSKDNISSATSKKNTDKFNTRTEHKCVTKTLFSSLDIQSAYYSVNVESFKPTRYVQLPFGIPTLPKPKL